MVTDEKTYEVTGALFPDATGTYEDAGEHNGKRYYQRTPNGWFLWWSLAGTWRISYLLGGGGDKFWERADPNIEGEYLPIIGVTGTATVTEA